MGFLKNLLGRKDEPVKTYAAFWDWFREHEKNFYSIVKSNKRPEKGFFDKLSEKLDQLKEGYQFLTGMYDDNTAELVITADGDIKNFVFVEELIAAAPAITGWKFTTLKPALNKMGISIDMNGYEFNEQNMYFYSNDLPGYPDEVDIVVVHDKMNEDNREIITQGVYIFMDNYLGELTFASDIDKMELTTRALATKELIPFNKISDFLTWREKEFVEKYEGIRYNTEKDEHAILEAELASGNKLVAVINTQLLNWDSKASHPWVAVLVIKYDGSNTNGMPASDDYENLHAIEEEILGQLKDEDGYLYVGRQTAEGEREIYFACRNFRKPSKVFYESQRKYKGKYEIDFDLYKDKYWRTFERFTNP